MEIKEFRNVLSKTLDLVDVGISEGYFESIRKDELNNKLITMFTNKIVYDLPGTAIYALYLPDEKSLCFNTKVFKNIEEALVYSIHEIKHGLDDTDNAVGFEDKETRKGVGSNEGATQRFATDIVEKMLQIEFPREDAESLGIHLNTHLDEYQIEDKLNELFCLTMNISMLNFIRMQNDPNKDEFNKLIDKFNKHASFDEFNECLDGIYKIQEETWLDEKGNMLEKEKEATSEQTTRAMNLIVRCKEILLSYAQVENPSVVDELDKSYFTAILNTGDIMRDGNLNTKEEGTMSDDAIRNQADYFDYEQNILNQANLDSDCNIVVVTEFRYDGEPKIYYRKGDTYYIIDSINNRKVTDINEILYELNDYEYEFGIVSNALEYEKLLRMSGEDKHAENVSKKWEHYLSKQNELDQIRQKDSSVRDEMERLRQSLYKL